MAGTTKLVKRAGAVLLAAAAATAAIGGLHTGPGRRLMALAGVGCPAGRTTPSEAEALRQAGLARLRGDGPALARPALGLTLDSSTEEEVARWAEGAGLACKPLRRGLHQLCCERVPAPLLGAPAYGRAIDEVTFAFAPNGRLVGAETLRRGLSGAGAAALFDLLVARLSTATGAAPELTGPASAAYLTGGPLHTAQARYRFADYVALLTAVNLPGSGIALREQYSSAARL